MSKEKLLSLLRAFLEFVCVCVCILSFVCRMDLVLVTSPKPTKHLNTSSSPFYIAFRCVDGNFASMFFLFLRRLSVCMCGQYNPTSLGIIYSTCYNFVCVCVCRFQCIIHSLHTHTQIERARANDATSK